MQESMYEHKMTLKLHIIQKIIGPLCVYKHFILCQLNNHATLKVYLN